MEEKQRKREEMRVMQAAINNPLIAEKIFEQAEFTDKKNIRLISRFWRDATLEEWRSNSAAIRIKFPTKFVNHYTAREWSYYTKNLFVETFERMMEGRQKTANTDWPAPFRIQEKPFRRVILVGGFFSLPPYKGRHLRSVAHVEEELKLFKFLDKFGFPHKYLRFEACEFVPDSYVEGMKWITMEACPRLKELSLGITIYDGYKGLTNLQGESFNTPRAEGSKLTKLEINYFYFRGLSFGGFRTEELILSPLPNLKSLKIGKARYEFLLGKMLCLANGKYLELDHLEIPIHLKNRLDVWSQRESIEFLNKYLELAQPTSFKTFHVQLEFSKSFKKDRLSTVVDPMLDRFFNVNGHLLTHLELVLKKPTHYEQPELATHLTGYHFPSLTHLTIIYRRKRWTCCSEDYTCPAGALYFDFASLQGMPRLEVFNCFDRIHGSEGEFSMAYQNLPIELSELKEFNFNCKDKITVSSLRMITGWMQSVKQLALHLDEETFPVVFEMAPQLEQLILLGKSGGLTLAEIDSEEMWLGQVERERQEMDWRKKTEAKSTQQFCGKLAKKKAKEIAQKEKRKSEREKRREEIEKEEKEWIEKQEDVEGSAWSFVSYRKNSQSEVIYFLPRQPRGKRNARYHDELVDDFTIFCKLREMTKTRNVRIFRTARVWNYRWENDISGLEDMKLIEYKIGGLE